MQANKRAFRGRVVQMDTAFTVLKDAVVWIEGNRIVAVANAAADPPQGFEHLTPLDTGGTMFPGLIELHNHLCYDILPLWAVPKRYDNRGQWQGTPASQKAVSKPMEVLTKKAGLAAEIARYTEAKCLLAGTTTSQGITLFSAPGIQKKYRGLVRNVEESLDANLPNAKAHIPDIAADTQAAFIKALNNSRCMLLHLSEGVGPTARKHFLDLKIDATSWAITAALTGIHCNGLLKEDFDRLAAAGAGMVWSPLSNLMLYGATAAIKVAKAAGLRIGVGSDWSPSGSKNLLHELRFIKYVSDQQGGLFSGREIVALATINAAGLLRWDRYLGSIEAGKYADLIVVRGTSGDPYAKLLAADESKIDLVVIDGVPRVATAALAAGFAATSETVAVGKETRKVNLDDASADSLVAGVTIAGAASKLQAAMSDLPNLATASPKATMAARATFSARPEWTIVLDQDEPHDLNLRTRFDAKAKATARVSSLAAAAPVQLDKMTLDPLTVASDPNYYPALHAQTNIPAAIKKALP